MRFKANQRGFTLVELLLALTVSGMLLTVLVTSILQTTRVTTGGTARIAALEDIKRVARPFANDVRMAQTTIPADGEPAVSSLTLDWTSWYDDSGGTATLYEVDYRVEYTFLQAEGKVRREYWKHIRLYTETYPSYWADYVSTNPPTSTTTFGRYISGIEFSRQGYLIAVTITSSPQGRAETEEYLTYQFAMHPTEVPIQ